MAIDQAKLQVKLSAILNKDVDDILAKHIYIPFVGSSYTRQQLVDWLFARSDLLEQAKTATDAQINTRITNYYNSLGVADKAIADKIIAGQAYDLRQASGFNAYEKLIAIVLSEFVKA